MGLLFPAALALLFAAPAAAGDEGETLSRMTLEQKLGQLLMVAVDTASAARYEPLIRSGRLGGALQRWERFDAEQSLLFSARMQEWVAGVPGAEPFLIAVDHEGGPLFTQKALGATIFPGNMALGAAGSEELARGAAEATARELAGMGIHIDFAPAVDINSNARNPIIGVRSFGEDPEAVARLGAAAIRGYLAGGVLPSAKHFPGHGDTETDSHTGLPLVARARAEFDRVELVPFRAAIAAGVPMIMTAHIRVPGLGASEEPATLSTAVITGLLRGELGFDGVVVSDSLDMAAVADRYDGPRAAVRALAAGCDLLLAGKADPERVLDALAAAVRSGELPRSRVDEAARRVLALKRRAAEGPPRARAAGEGRALARLVAERAVTVLADKGVLPLTPRRPGRLAFVAFGSPRFAGEFERFGRALLARHPKAELWFLPPDAAGEHPERVLASAREAELVVVATYGWGAKPDARQVDMARRLWGLGKTMVRVSLMNPYDLDDFPEADALLAVYGITDASLEALARVLFGEVKPSGHLPVAAGGFPRGAGL